jgi:hypothetical protein
MMNGKIFLRSTAAAMAILLPVAAYAVDGTNFDELPEPVRKSVKVIAPDIASDAIKIKTGTTCETLVEYVDDRGVNFELAIAPDGTIQRIDETLRYRPLPTSSRNDRIADVASINEDIVEFALAGDAGRVRKKFIDLKAALLKLRSDVHEATYQAVSDELAGIEAALGQSDMTGVELAAVEAYRTLEQEMAVRDRVAPIEVSMLDYSGFKLSAFANAKKLDWAAIQVAADEAKGFWSLLQPSVTKKGLKDLMNTIHAGFEEAVQRQNAAQLAFAAKLELDAVDLLEGHFADAYKTGAGALPVVEAGDHSR